MKDLLVLIPFATACMAIVCAELAKDRRPREGRFSRWAIGRIVTHAKGSAS